MFEIVDLSQPLTRQSRSFPGTIPALVAETVDVGSEDIRVSRFVGFELHAGTHMDAPLHFAPNGSDIAGLPLRLLPAVLVSTDGADVNAQDIPLVCDGRAVLLSTGWERRAATEEYYSGYPEIAADAAELLVIRRAALVGVDTPSVDSVPPDPTYPSHRILCGAGIPVVEGLVNLLQLARYRRAFFFAAFPLPFVGFEASPVRAVALIPE